LLLIGSRPISITKNSLSLFDEIPQLIHNKEVMDTKAEKYTDDTDFQEFLNREFDHTAVDATIEELAEFAFGSVDAAIEAFEERIKNES